MEFSMNGWLLEYKANKWIKQTDVFANRSNQTNENEQLVIYMLQQDCETRDFVKSLKPTVNS